jgi:pimeloyl-ACP methyl ester carboxylesterase
MFGGGINNFGYQKIVENYHLVVISMPHTPVVAKKEQVNDRFQYVPDKLTGDTYFQPFIKADYLDNYVYRAQAVLSFLKKQQWVQPARLVVSGHSQGAKVAAKVALANKDVTHLGLFSPNPFGRVDEFIRRARLDAQLGRISWEEADSIMNHYYDFFETAHQTDSLRSNPSLKAWNSFSETFFDDWLELDIPIYLAYGTEDRAADLCDVVPLFFIKAGKNNLTLRRYLRLGHNFFGVDEKGRTNYDIAHWSEVMHAFLKWMQ